MEFEGEMEYLNPPSHFRGGGDGESDIMNIDNMRVEMSVKTEPEIMIADRCLLCGNVAIIYDLTGEVIKRERVENGFSYEELFTYLCQCLGVRKNAKLKKDWNFDVEPFPFCGPCEQLVGTLGEIYSRLGELERALKDTMIEGEEKYTSLDLYELHDLRYAEFRKQVLGVSFKGGEEVRRTGRKRTRKDFSTYQTTKIKSDVTTVEEACSELRILKIVSTKGRVEHGVEEVLPSDLGWVNGDDELMDPDIFDTGDEGGVNNFENNLTSPLPVNEETIPERVVAERGVCTENESNNLIQERPETTITAIKEEIVDEPLISNSDTVRRRRQPRRCTVSRPDYRKLLSSESSDEEGATTKKKRRPKAEVKQEDEISSYINDENEIIRPKRKRGRPKKVKEEVDEWMPKDKPLETRRKRKSQLQDFETSMDFSPPEDASFANSIYSMNVPLVTDPVTRNIYFRTLLFVRLDEDQCFQCSTCSEMIPFANPSRITIKFHAHFLRFHSDYYNCQYCVDLQFQTSEDLNQHVSINHLQQIYPNHEQKVKTETQKTYKFRKPYQHLRKPYNSARCAICGKPGPPTNTAEYREHFLTHLNAEERERELAKLNETLNFEIKPKQKRLSKLSIKNENLYDTAKPKGKRGRKPKGFVSFADNSVKEPHGDRRGASLPLGKVSSGQIEMMKQEQLNYTPDFDRPSFSCAVCGIKMLHKESLENHMRLRHPLPVQGQGGSEKCQFPKCNQSFLTELDLEAHVKTCHAETQGGNTEYLCHQCGRVFENLTRLRRHSVVHTEERNFKCRVCGAAFAHNTALQDHLTMVHKFGGNTFKCEVPGCGLEFTCKRFLRSHMTSVHNSKLKQKSHNATGIGYNKTRDYPNPLYNQL